MQANKPISWSLGELLKDWTTMQTNSSTTEITGLSVDSRITCPGDLFFALKGMQQHGLKYGQQAINNGAAAIAWETYKDIHTQDLPTEVPCVEIEDLQQRLGFICRRFYNNVTANMHVIGVTGTDGKTSVSQFIAQAFQNLDTSCGVIGTLGYGVYPDFDNASHTTPDAVRLHGLLNEFYSHDVKHAVIEASSHGLKQGRLNGVEFNTAVLTNLSRDHMDYHTTIEDYRDAKRILFEVQNLENAVINIDDGFGRQLAKEFSDRLNVIQYSIKDNSILSKAYIKANYININSNKTSFEIDSSWGHASIETNLAGKFNVSNLLAVLAALLGKGIAFNDAINAIKSVCMVAGRLELIDGGKALPTVVIDYAHTPQALINVLTVLREQCKGKIWCVFGCGGNRDPGKRMLMAEAVEKFADIPVVTDDNPRYENPDDITKEIIKGFSPSSNYMLIHDRCDAIQFAIENAKSEDTVLIAGKGHETIQIVKDVHLPFDDKKIAVQIMQQIS